MNDTTFSSTPSLVPDDTDLNFGIMDSTEIDGAITVYAELGPVFDLEAGRDVFLNCSVGLRTEAPTKAVFVNYFGVQSQSLLEAMDAEVQRQLDEDPVDDPSDKSYHELDVQEIASRLTCDEETHERFLPDIHELSAIALMYLEDYINESHSELSEQFSELTEQLLCADQATFDEISEAILSSVAGATVISDDSFVEIDHDEDDSRWSLTAQFGPIYDEDEEQYVLFIDVLEYDTDHPDCYLFTKDIVIADTEETFYDDNDVIDGEWMHVDDDSDLEEKYFAEFEHIEARLLEALFNTVDDKDALVKLAEELEEEGRIERID